LEHAESYVGLDWSDSMHDTKADIFVDLNESIDVPNDVADTVVSFSVLEHLHSPQVILNEAYRVLKCGGHIVLSALANRSVTTSLPLT